MTRCDSEDSEPTGRTPLCLCFESRAAFRAVYRADISRGGVFVPTSDPPAPRELVEVEFRLDEGAEALRLEGEVVQQVVAELASEEGEPGVAVEFSLPVSEVRRLFESRIGALAERAPFSAPAKTCFRVEPHALPDGGEMRDLLEASLVDLADSGLTFGRMLELIPEPEDRIRRCLASLLEAGVLQRS